MAKKYVKWKDDTGQTLRVHHEDDCSGVCPIHNPSDHHMVDWPRHYRCDRGIMERICPHGIGHPDPDDLRIINGDDDGTHGCDGCCRSPKMTREDDESIRIYEKWQQEEDDELENRITELTRHWTEEDWDRYRENKLADPNHDVWSEAAFMETDE